MKSKNLLHAYDILGFVSMLQYEKKAEFCPIHMLINLIKTVKFCRSEKKNHQITLISPEMNNPAAMSRLLMNQYVLFINENNFLKITSVAPCMSCM